MEGNAMKILALLLLMPALTGCSADDDTGPAAKRGHVWQEQTDMIRRAGEVEDLLGTADLQRRQQLEAQAQ